MLIKDILSIDRIASSSEIQSKKVAFEHLASMLAEQENDLTSVEVFDGLIARERLGSTGLGAGVAIPHGRMPLIKDTIGAFLKLSEGVDLDAPDNQPVSLFFAMLVPEETTDEHLNILAKLAELFSDESLLQQLQETENKEKIYQLLTEKP